MAEACGVSGDSRELHVRAFAVFASIIMLLVIFQVVSGEVCASLQTELESSDGVETPASGNQPQLHEDDPDEMINTETTEPWYGAVDKGTVDSYGISPDMSPSTLPASRLFSELEVNGGKCTYRTSFGIYVLDSAAPWSLSLTDNAGEVHVTSSYFTVKCSGVILAPSGGEILEMGTKSFACQYDLVDPGAPTDVRGSMEVIMEFHELTSPKMTARLLDLTYDTEEWCVVWIVEVPEDTCISSSYGGDVPLSAYRGCTVPTKGFRLECTRADAREYELPATFAMDWSDAKSGTLRVLKCDPSVRGVSSLMVEFDEGVPEIDPTVVSQSSVSSATGLACQRKTFWYDGYYWAFYISGTDIYYSSSRDGNSWSSQRVLDAALDHYVSYAYGFDVYQRNGKVIVGWTGYTPTAPHVYFAMIGTVTEGTIKWSGPYTVTVCADTVYPDPVSVTITGDGSCWLLGRAYPLMASVYRYDESEDIFSEKVAFLISSDTNWYALMPTTDSNLAILYATYGTSTLTLMYFRAGQLYGPIISAPDYTGGITTGSKANAFSATIGPDNTIHIAYIHNGDNSLAYSYFDGVWVGEIVTAGTQTSPSIALDGNNIVHIFYGAGSPAYSVRHKEASSAELVWSSEHILYTSSYEIRSISSWCRPTGSNAFVFTEYPYSYDVKFMTCPIPFGSAGVAANPWDREGLSPYGIYFSSMGDSISPGSGLLNFMQTDVSVSGRGGVNLDVTRLYNEPRYFWKSTGTPYATYSYPYCPMGLGWGLDLPWLSDMFVTIPGGQSFPIQWGNTGDPDEFECHDGAHFILRHRDGSLPRGDYDYYELKMSSGAYYIFESTYRLSRMGSAEASDPETPFGFGVNYLELSYDASNRVSTIVDYQERTLTFAYDDTKNRLQSVTRSDGRSVTYGYTLISGQYLLTSVTDPMGRVTSYSYYSGSTYSNCILLATVTFPSLGKFIYSYAVDDTAGTDVRSWTVTSRETRDASSGALIRQTVFDPKIVGGRIQFTTVTEKDDSAATQGYREYILSSRLKYTSEVAKSSTGTQLYKTVTWYDSSGQPVRVDTYKGTSASISYSEYTSYDDWGNVIFTKNAMGYESYASFINTDTQNSFQGGMVLKRTSSGCVLYDGFDDWDASDWSQSAAGIAIDGNVNSIGAPALKFTSSTSEVYAYRTVTSQSGDLVLQIRMMVLDSDTTSYVEMLYGSTARIRIAISGGVFQYGTSSGLLPVPNSDSCLDQTWYDVDVYITDFASNAYSIYIDGEWKCDATMMGTTNTAINTLKVRALTGSTLWVDQIKLYKGLTIPLTMSSDYVAELLDAYGEPVDRDDTTLVIPSPATVCAPGAIRVFKVGDRSFETAVMDIWGGDTYELSLGVVTSSAITTTNLPKTTNGFGRYTSAAPDDYWPPGFFKYPSSVSTEGSWVYDHDYSVVGNAYHLSPFINDYHYHGFYGYSAFTVSSTSLLIQYVWLTDGEEPQEIALQFYAAGAWRRAYWGGLAGSNEDAMYVEAGYSPTVRFRVGDIPAQRDAWVQLTVKASDLGVTTSSTVSGVLYGLWGGGARWDLTSYFTSGIQITGIASSYTVDLKLDDGRTISGTSTSSTLTMDLYASGEKTFPISGHFDISYGGSLLYSSPQFAEIFNGDIYTYSAPAFYANEVSGDIHSAMVAAFQYQKSDNTVAQKSYNRLDSYANVVEAKTYTGSGWAYMYAGYDGFGNLIWQKNPTGLASFTEYSAADGYTYPVATRQLGDADYFETPLWTAQESGSSSFLSGNTVGISSWGAYYSPTKSVKLSFGGIDDGSVVDSGLMYREYSVDRISSVSVRMYTTAYSHDLDAGEYMDAGIRMRLYDSGGVSLGAYTYWLACWSSSGDTRTTTDPTIKIVEDRATLSTWYTYALYPDLDWSIDWSSCAKVRFELYMAAYIIGGDSFTCYFDDFMTDSATKYSYDFQTGNLLSATDAYGSDTSYTHDYLGRTTKITYDDGSTEDFIYDDASNTVTSYDESDLKTRTGFDKVGRVSYVYWYGSSTSIQSTLHYTYTWNDKVKTYTDERLHVTSYTYDFFGRLLRTTHLDAKYNEYSYDDVNNKVTYKDELLHTVWEKTFDNLGRLITVKEYASSTLSYTTQMTYDATGNLLAVVDAKTTAKATTALTYDTLGRQTAITYYLGLEIVESETATYDLAGRLLTRVDKSGVTTTSEYDVAGRIWSVKNPSETVRYFRDALGRTLKLDGTYDVIYTYNFRGLITSIQKYASGSLGVITLGYTAAGVMNSITYPNSAVVTYSFDLGGRPNNVKLNGTTVWSCVYYLDGRIDTETFIDTTVADYNYDTRDRLDTATWVKGTTTTLSLDYNYDDVGNVQGLVSSSGGTESYTYDYLSRMTSATGIWGTISYTYDEVGNRKTMVVGGVTTTYTYDSDGLNQIENDGTWSYLYDDNGQMTWRQGSSVMYHYGWDYAGQMTQVDKFTLKAGKWSSSTVASDQYSADGSRVSTFDGVLYTAGGTYRNYFYVGQELWVQRDGVAGDVTTDTYSYYIYVGGDLKVKWAATAGKVYCYFNDALGSTWQVWTAGAKKATFSVVAYKPFGVPYTQTGTESVKFAGEVLDTATAPSGLYYLRARYMDPELGRFISMDPELGSLSHPQTMNRYVYCVNNPLRYVDPTGEFSMSKWWDDNWQTAALVGMCIAVTVATGGLGGGLAAGILYGAIAGAGTNMLIYSTQTALAGGELTLQGMAAAGVSGAITGAVGAVTGGVGSGAIKIGGSLGARLGGSLLGRVATAAGIGAAGGEISYVSGEFTKMALTGGREGSISLRGLLFAAAAGAAAGATIGYLKSVGYKPGLDDYRSMESYGAAAWASLPGATFTALMSTAKSVGKPWTESAEMSTQSARTMLPIYVG